MLLFAIIGEQKYNFNGGFKLKLVIIYHLGFFIKLLWS